MVYNMLILCKSVCILQKDAMSILVSLAISLANCSGVLQRQRWLVGVKSASRILDPPSLLHFCLLELSWWIDGVNPLHFFLLRSTVLSLAYSAARNTETTQKKEEHNRGHRDEDKCDSPFNAFR